MELDDLILSMINMTGIETDMVRDVENIRFESTVYRNNGRWGLMILQMTLILIMIEFY